MRRLPLGLICLTLAACAPVEYITPSAIGPAELQRYSDSATNTAAAVVASAAAAATQDARQAAQATATDQSSRATATAARAATLEALQGRQTEVALSLTQAAGLAAATDSQAARTEHAQATAVWATPTAAAMRALATAQAAQDARSTAQAETMAEFWATVRTLIVALLAVGGLTAICVACVGAVTRIRVAHLASQAAIAREAFRLLPPGHWAEWAPGEGYQVYALPGQLDAPAAIIENAPTAPDKVHEWRQAVRLFCWWGDRYGFGIEHLGASGRAVVSDPGWKVMTKLLRAAGVLAYLPIPGQKGRVTTWAAGWDYRTLHDELAHGRLTLPYPADDDAPKVAFTVPDMTTNQPGADKPTSQQAMQKASD